MDAAIIVLGGLGVVIALFGYVSAMLSGGTASDIAGSSADHARVVADLGQVRRTFTNYTPWRFRFGVLMLVVGGISIAIQRMQDIKELQLVAGFAFLFGIVTLLYVIFKRIDHLDLHARGLVLREGKVNAKAVYYTEIANMGLHGVILASSHGTPDHQITKGLVVELHDGGSFEIGHDFMQFGQIADAIEEQAVRCDAEQNLVGTYTVFGTHLNNGDEMEVEVEARSPRYARKEALDRFGVIAEKCSRAAGKRES